MPPESDQIKLAVLIYLVDKAFFVRWGSGLAHQDIVGAVQEDHVRNAFYSILAGEAGCIGIINVELLK